MVYICLAQVSAIAVELPTFFAYAKNITLLRAPETPGIGLKVLDMVLNNSSNTGSYLLMYYDGFYLKPLSMEKHHLLIYQVYLVMRQLLCA